jgi:PilZ domain
MDAEVSLARQARSQHRHELRTLTYVTIDQANGGVVRNLTHEGIGAQVVAALRPKHQLRVRFELQSPRVRVEAQGEVVWSTPSGQCGIRFLDLSPRTSRQIKEWIFGDLLEGAALHSRSAEWMFGSPLVGEQSDGCADEDDGLMISPASQKVIELPATHEDASDPIADDSHLDWLSQPLSANTLAWTVNVLVVFAALLLFVLVFLSVNREAPPWPLTTTAGAAVLVGLMYWGFFEIFGGGNFGQRLARLAGLDRDQVEDEDARFR